MVNSFYELSALVSSGFDDWGSLGNIYAREKDGLLLLNYTAQAQYSGRWSWIERHSRGLILDAKTGEIKALPFPKFFNWLEGGRCTDAHLVEATEKLDGSMGLSFMASDGPAIATRGSFDGDQALWATDYLRRTYRDLIGERWNPDVTLLFEIIYPDNRIVVDYGDREDLVLIGATNIITHADYRWFPDLVEIANTFGLSTPKFYQFNSWKAAMDAKDALSRNEEGFVLRFADGQRFKFKGDAYLEAHRIISNLSFKSVLEAVRNGRVRGLLEQVPEEYHGDIHDYLASIEQTVASVTYRAQAVFNDAPKDSRKEFAIWVNRNHRDLAPYLFAMADGKDIEALVLKLAF